MFLTLVFSLLSFNLTAIAHERVIDQDVSLDSHIMSKALIKNIVPMIQSFPRPRDLEKYISQTLGGASAFRIEEALQCVEINDSAKCILLAEKWIIEESEHEDDNGFLPHPFINRKYSLNIRKYPDLFKVFKVVMDKFKNSELSVEESFAMPALGKILEDKPRLLPKILFTQFYFTTYSARCDNKNCYIEIETRRGDKPEVFVPPRVRSFYTTFSTSLGLNVSGAGGL